MSPSLTRTVGQFLRRYGGRAEPRRQPRNAETEPTASAAARADGERDPTDHLHEVDGPKPPDA